MINWIKALIISAIEVLIGVLLSCIPFAVKAAMVTLCILFLYENVSASPWDEGFQGPVSEETKIDCRVEKCA